FSPKLHRSVMEQDPYRTQDASFSTRRQTVTRRPGEASRQPIRQPLDVEASPTRGGVQFDIPAGTGGGGATTSSSGGLNRKRTLVRPERQRVNPTHRNYHYLQHTQQQNMPVQASTTGNRANVPIDEYDDFDEYDQGAPSHYTTQYGPESPGQSPGPSPT